MTAHTTLPAIYLVHRRSEHEFREWIIMPSTGMIPINVWTRFVSHEGARPVWRGTRHSPHAGSDRRVILATSALDAVANTIVGHARQNARFPESKQWFWDEPIVVETSSDEVAKHTHKTPYPVLRRIDRVKAKRAKAAEKNAESVSSS